MMTQVVMASGGAAADISRALLLKQPFTFFIALVFYHTIIPDS